MNPPPDRLPPHDEAAEAGALGCILLNPREGMEEFCLLVKVGVEAFYVVKHQTIFQGLHDLWTAKRSMDPITLANHLRKNSLLDDAGGSEYIGSLPDFTPSAANLPSYTALLNEHYGQRRILAVCARFSLSVYAGGQDFETVLGNFEREALAVRQTIEQGRDLTDVPAIQKELLGDYDEALSNKKRPGVGTGFEEVDRIIGGFKPQDLIIVGASPSSGKTSFVLNVMEDAILRQDLKVGVISLETSSKKLLHRVNCSVCQVDGSAFMRGTATQEQIDSIIRSHGKSGDSTRIGQNLLLSDRGGLTIGQAAGIFRLMYKNGARLFMLDYLQLLSSGKNNGGRRVEEMTLVSTGLKAIAKDLNCPVIVVSSISRDSEKENRAPRLSDLRDSGQLEFDADMCVLLHRKDNDPDERTVYVDVAKNKDGQIGKTELIFVPYELRFYSPAALKLKNAPKEAKLL